MRKFIVLFCSLLFTVQYVVAQHSLYVITKDCKLEEYPSITKVFFDSSQFVFEYGEVTEITKSSFSASVKVSVKSEELKTISQTIEVGICFSDINATPTIQNRKILLGSSLDNYSFSINVLDSGTTYYYRAYVKVGEAVDYGDVYQETTFGEKPEYITVNGHKFIDLGLPSGLLWAETNIGAETAYDDGNYYAWGETAPKSEYNSDNYDLSLPIDSTYSEIYEKYLYTYKYGGDNGKTVLDKEDDAAYVNWGSGCRMPTLREFGELKDNCTWAWVSRTNSVGETINCYKVISNINGNIIYLPASGSRFENLYGDTFHIHGEFGCYWSNTVGNGGAYYLHFYHGRSNGVYYERIYDRYKGCTVRSVAEPSASQEGQTIQPTVSAQQNMWMVDDNGNANVLDVSTVDIAIFHADSNWFSITDDGINAKATDSFSASCTVALANDGAVKSLGITPEVGVCYSDENISPTINDKCQTLGSALGSYSFTLTSLSAGTTYYYRVYVKLNDGVFYGDAVNVKTLGTKTVDNSKTINGHNFVDLGLPSGVLWAEVNIGAKIAADDGCYYAWGDISTKSSYSWGNYKYANNTKYNSTDGKTVLDKGDDAAYMNYDWGYSCRIPTEAEFEELLNSDNCTWTWTSMENSSGSSVNGYKVTSKRNGNFIFLPASGYRDGYDLYGHEWSGFYWSSTLYSNEVSRTYCLAFASSNHFISMYSRCWGLTIRPVAEP